MEFDRQSLDEWAKDKPLSILQLDPADRAVLKIAGKLKVNGQKYVFVSLLKGRISGEKGNHEGRAKCQPSPLRQPHPAPGY